MRWKRKVKFLIIVFYRVTNGQKVGGKESDENYRITSGLILSSLLFDYFLGFLVLFMLYEMRNPIYRLIFITISNDYYLFICCLKSEY